MAIDALITVHHPTDDALRAVGKLALMLRMRGFRVTDPRPADNPQQLASLADIARRATWVVVFLDSTLGPEDSGLKAWLQWAGLLHASSNGRVVLVSAGGAANRAMLPQELRTAPITRVDRPLGFHRVCAKLGAAAFIGGFRGDDRGPRLPYVDDAPADEDALGMRPLVQRVTELIQTSKRPMTISVEGPWGSGKSSFLRLLQGELTRNPVTTEGATAKPPRVVRFNPWRLDKSDSLWSSFAVQFYDQLYEVPIRDLLDPTRRRDVVEAFKARIHLGWQRLNLDKGLVPVTKLGFLSLVCLVALLAIVVHSYIPIIPLVLTKAAAPAEGSTNRWLSYLLLVPGLAPVVGFARSMKPRQLLRDVAAASQRPDYEGRLPFIEQFQKDFQRVISAFSKYRIVVFIDDLDRCEMNVTAELCQAISQMIPEDSDMVFVIAMDREKVAAGIAARAEKVLPMLAAGRQGGPGFDGARALDFGFRSLEKSVQLSVRLPPAREEELQKIVPPMTEQRQELCKLVTLVARALANNPRRVKHFLNVWSLNTPLLEDDPDLTQEQLAKLLAITLRWPRLVPDIADDRMLLADLEELAIDPDAHILTANPGSTIARWAKEEELRLLLAAGVATAPGENRANAARNTFLGVDVRRLLGARRTLPLPTANTL
jgi:hypothetical protein